MKVSKVHWMVPLDQHGNTFVEGNTYPIYQTEEGLTEKARLHAYLCRVQVDFGHGDEVYDEMKVSPAMFNDSGLHKTVIDDSIREQLNRRITAAVMQKLRTMWVVSQ